MENQREFLRCDVTGKLYPSEEMVVAVIKIIKHKDADINSLNIFNADVQVKGESIKSESDTKKIVPDFDRPFGGEGANDAGPMMIHKTTVDNPDVIHVDELKKTPRNNPIPKGIFSTMFPPGHPMHESRGAKEFRQT